MKIIIRILLLLGLILALDIYAFQAIQTSIELPWVRYAYWGIHGLYYFMVIAGTMAFSFNRRSGSRFFSWMFSLFVILYLPKAFVMLFLLGEDMVRGVRWIFGQTVPRSVWLSNLALATSAVPLAAAIWGVLRTKYDYAVRKVEVPVKNLPESFEGFTIAQISDIHTGSLENLQAVAKGIDKVNEQGTDVIVFTGDLVNNLSAELKEEFVEVFSRLKAPDGVYSILGNHDYGDYVRWESKEKKTANLQNLIDTQARMGWDLLMNEHRIVERNGEKLAILGVENWSAWSRFPAHGKLDEAYQGTEDIAAKVLLSHDPTHWDAQVRPDYPDIDLTLSGHTHGMQFGIEFPGFKWSPVQYMFKQWAGHYTQGDQHLYVNRGFGFIGFSGRIGIRPEITVLTLKRG